MREFHPAPPHPGMLELRDRHIIVGGDRRSGLVHEMAIHENAPGHDQRLRFRAGVDEAALDEDDVEALLFHFPTARFGNSRRSRTVTNSRTRLTIPSACRSYWARRTSCAPWCTYSSGIPMRWKFTSRIPRCSHRSMTALPKPPASEPSSTVMMYELGVQYFAINSSSKGLMKRALITATLMFSLESVSAASYAGQTSLPIAKIVASAPSRSTSPLPIGRAMISASSFAPMPLPRG